MRGHIICVLSFLLRIKENYHQLIFKTENTLDCTCIVSLLVLRCILLTGSGGGGGIAATVAALPLSTSNACFLKS